MYIPLNRFVSPITNLNLSPDVNKCRMNPNIPLAAISFGNSQGSLALVDTYKKELLSNDPLRLAKKCGSFILFTFSHNAF